MDAHDIWNTIAVTPPSNDFLDGGGAMGDAIRAFDWASTSLGPMEGWPVSLKSTLRMMLTSRQPISVFWGRDLLMFYNDAYAPFLTDRHERALGRLFEEIWSDVWEDVQPFVVEALSGRGTWSEDMRLMMLRNGVMEETFWTYSYSPLYGDRGEIAGMINITSDTTANVHGRAAVEQMIGDAQRQLEHQATLDRQRRVVQREMAHRIKNILSMTMAVVSQSLRHAGSIADAEATIVHRIGALARAQDVLTSDHLENVDVHALISQAVAPHQDRDGRIMIDGHAVKVSSQQALGLSLAIHELATNAVKYGALSSDAGRVRVFWRESENDAFRLEWTEAGGPSVTPPTRSGFGSRLTSRIVAGYFRGKGELVYEPTGLRYLLTGRIDRPGPNGDTE